MLFLIAFCFITGVTEGLVSTKKWNKEILFDDPNNWIDKQTPCMGNRIIFLSDAVLSLGRRFSHPLMVLPKNGLILLDDDFVFDTNTPSSRECASAESTFVGGVTPGSWFDPANWDSLIDVETFSGSLDNNPIPHSDRIPCKFDKVSIPMASRIKLTYPVDVSIASFELDGIELSQQSLNEFMTDSVGKLVINNPLGRKISTNAPTCSDVTGCACGNDDRTLLPRICTFVLPRCAAGVYKSSAPKCLNRVKPDGFCCPICGTFLTAKYQASKFKYSLLENLVKIFLSSHAVKFYMSKTFSNRIQIVIVDETPASEFESISASPGLNSAIKLKETLTLDSHYGLSDIVILSSYQNEIDTDANPKMTLIIVCGILGIIFGVVLIVYCRNRVLDSVLVDNLRLSLRGALSVNKRDSIAADFVRFQDDRIELRSTPSSGSSDANLERMTPMEVTDDGQASKSIETPVESKISNQDNLLEDFLI